MSRYKAIVTDENGLNDRTYIVEATTSRPPKDAEDGMSVRNAVQDYIRDAHLGHSVDVLRDLETGQRLYPAEGDV